MSNQREQSYAALRATRPRLAPASDCAQAFVTRLTAQGGSCAQLATLAGLPQHLLQRYAPEGTGRLCVSLADGPLAQDIDWAVHERLQLLESSPRAGYPLVVTRAFAAVAETGSVALYPRAAAPMGQYFLPDRLVVVIEEVDIVATLDDFWQRARAHFPGGLPRALCLMSGPSTTADVALTFANGVHGPIELHVAIVSPSAPD
jgi:L-lactate dehydrogenase complex protein LldG